MLKHDVNLNAAISARIFDVRFPTMTMWFSVVLAIVGGMQGSRPSGTTGRLPGHRARIAPGGVQEHVCSWIRKNSARERKFV